MKIRLYEGLQDLNAMLDLLAEGRQAHNGTYYVHRGDLQWWLFYTDVPQEKWQSNIRLWMEDDRLIGWTLLSPDDHAFDVFTEPVDDFCLPAFGLLPCYNFRADPPMKLDELLVN